MAERVVLPAGPTPFDALVGPLPGDLEAALARRYRRDGEREAAGVQRGERELQPFALTAQDVLFGDAVVGEVHDYVIDLPETHVVEAVLDGHACQRGTIA